MAMVMVIVLEIVMVITMVKLLVGNGNDNRNDSGNSNGKGDGSSYGNDNDNDYGPLIVEINSQVALFRDMLIHVGQTKDCPELREKIRKLRRTCVEACKHTGQIIMPQVKKSENRAGPSNLGNVISQILLCKQITSDFNQEELCSITKDSQDIAVLLSEMQEYMPQHDTYLGE
ncbi:uncharacterized protein LOC118742038 [Rhagoletis pomonella]|uniref:uncharacterized protein LOC118742038 n=1 Tax=Rhagoletis pomonella TaxID=28610 RepID=UPI001785F029|nr:uncharacterized protein LOC118742038 [Rhagoletis pomonella]